MPCGGRRAELRGGSKPASEHLTGKPGVAKSNVDDDRAVMELRQGIDRFMSAYSDCSTFTFIVVNERRSIQVK